jgi:hypothetical protein
VTRLYDKTKDAQYAPIIYIVPLVEDGDDASAVNADELLPRLGHVEGLARRVASAAVVVGQVPVGRAEVGDRDGDRHARLAPVRLRLVVARDPVALPA